MPLSQTESNSEYLRTLISKVANGDAEAFRLVHDETSHKLFNCALRILRRADLAEDVLQESFIAVWKSANGYQASLSAPMTWMSTIVRNKAFDLLRSTHHLMEADSLDADAYYFGYLVDQDPLPLDALENRRNILTMAHCICQLNHAHRQVIYMAYFDDLSHSEIANELALPIGTIKSWIKRSVKRLGVAMSRLETNRKTSWNLNQPQRVFYTSSSPSHTPQFL